MLTVGLAVAVWTEPRSFSAPAAAGWVQAFAAIASTSLLAGTLYFTYQAVVQTKENVGLQRAATLAQVRPYVSIENFRIKSQANGNWVCKVDVSNRGMTPAHNVEIYTEYAVVPLPCTSARWSMTRTSPQHRGMLQKDGRMRPAITVTAQDALTGQSNTNAIMVMVQVDYRDSFGGTYRRRANYHYHGAAFSIMHPGSDANDETVISKPHL